MVDFQVIEPKNEKSFLSININEGKYENVIIEFIDLKIDESVNEDGNNCEISFTSNYYDNNEKEFTEFVTETFMNIIKRNAVDNVSDNLDQ